MRPFVLLASIVPLALLAGCGALRTAPPAPPPLAARGIALPTGFAYPAHDTLRVATWNVENLVDGADDPYVDAPLENEGGRDREAKLRRLVTVLRALDADVVILEEFEHSRWLRALAAERFPDLGYRWFAGTESPTWYQNVVVMSRLPLGVLRNYANVHTPVPGIRDSLGRPEVQSQINSRMWLLELFARDGMPLHVAGLHLKAGRTPRDTAMRSGQVRFLQGELRSVAASSAGLLVAGDLNATPGSRELDELLAGAGVGVPLVDPLAGRGVLSHPARTPTRQLDHILLDRRLAARLVPDGVRVMTPLPPAEMGAISDHLPLMATFVLR